MMNVCEGVKEEEFAGRRRAFSPLEESSCFSSSTNLPTHGKTGGVLLPAAWQPGNEGETPVVTLL